MADTLSDGLSTRPPTMSDVDAVTALLRADEAAATGEARTGTEDIRGDWSRPSVDLAGDVVLVHDGEQLVGYADHFAGRAWVAVAPTHHGRGIGAWLLAWTERQARRHGRRSVGQTIADVHVAATRLLDAHGYVPRWHSWVFTIELGSVGHTPLPLRGGMTVRSLVRPVEDAAVHQLIETAFSEWPDREPGMAFADWRASTLERDDVEVLVVDDGGVLAGAAVCIDEGRGEGWVEQLAVARGHRGRGLARALLHAAFGHFRARGCTSAGLSTDSRTGARTLYEHVGMAVTQSYTRWSKPLTGA